MTDYDGEPDSGSDINPHVDGGCPICGQAHTTPTGLPSCHGHRTLEDGVTKVPCRKRPIGSAHGKMCRSHGGAMNHVAAATRQRVGLANLRAEFDKLGGQVDVSPTEAMLTMVREAAGNVLFYRRHVEQLQASVDGDPPVIINDEGVAVVQEGWVGAGVATRDAPDKWTASPHVLVRLYNEERDRLVRYSKLCRDAGVDEARVRIEAAQGEWLVRTLDAVLDRLELTDDQQRRLPVLMGEVIAELEEPE